MCTRAGVDRKRNIRTYERQARLVWYVPECNYIAPDRSKFACAKTDFLKITLAR